MMLSRSVSGQKTNRASVRLPGVSDWCRQERIKLQGIYMLIIKQHSSCACLVVDSMPSMDTPVFVASRFCSSFILAPVWEGHEFKSQFLSQDFLVFCFSGINHHLLIHLIASSFLSSGAFQIMLFSCLLHALIRLLGVEEPLPGSCLILKRSKRCSKFTDP